jgi:hypothetical protein
MRVATLRRHPTDANFVLLAVGAELNPTMGRFEPARLSTEHRAYLIHADDIDALGRFLRIHNVAVADERHGIGTPTAPKWTRAAFKVVKCWDCDCTQRKCDEQCHHCQRCHNCDSGSLNTEHEIDADEQREINARGLAKIRPLLQGWPLRTNDEPAAARAALHAVRKDTP